MSPLGRLGVAWGLGGTALLLLDGVVRLVRHVRVLDLESLTALQWVSLVGWCAVMAIVEGYRGFQRNFVPRLVARAWHLGHNPRPLHLALAPFFCMAMLHATPRRLIGAWSLLFGIIALVVLVRMLEQPWRGIIDAGVIVGLSWGVATLVSLSISALKRGPPIVSLDLPGPR